MESNSRQEYETLSRYASGHEPETSPMVQKMLTGYFGSWLIERPLGQGGQGQVFYATKSRSQGVGVDRGALKVTLAEKAEEKDWLAYETEVEALKTLDSAYIARLKEHGIQNAMPWLVSSYIEGQSLSLQLQEVTQLPHIEWLRLAEHLFVALQEAHSNEIMHRDIKPSNIMFNSRERTYILIDFGLAAREDCLRLGVRAGGKTLSTRERGGGSTLYQAPEQIKREPSVKSDIFAAGVLLYEAYLGVNPWVNNILLDGENPTDPELQIEQILLCSPDLTSLDENYQKFFEQVLEPNSELRPEAWEVLEWLSQWQITGSFYFEQYLESGFSQMQGIDFMDMDKALILEDSFENREEARTAIGEFFDSLPKSDFKVVLGIKDQGTISLRADYSESFWRIELKILEGSISGRELEQALLQSGFLASSDMRWDLKLSGIKAPATLGDFLFTAIDRLFPESFPKIRLY
jgi:serine/threonine protein kinase